jgi:hypothetical protein
MPLQMAFGITVEDVRTVLKNNADKLVNQSGHSIEAMAALIYHGLDEDELDDIALAAMDAFVDGKPETDGAHRALRTLLVKRGFLDVSRRSHVSAHPRRQKEKADMMMAVCR